MSTSTYRPRLLAILALVLCAVLALAAAGIRLGAAEAEPVTTVYVVRHAEKAAEGGSDPTLSAAGEARAEELRHVLSDAGIDAVFVTEFRRTRRTGEPTAAAAGVEPRPYGAVDTTGLAEKIRSEHAGESVLVVGHSNTVDDLAAALGAPGVAELVETQFDRLFVVHLGSWGSRLRPMPTRATTAGRTRRRPRLRARHRVRGRPGDRSLGALTRDGVRGREPAEFLGSARPVDPPAKDRQSSAPGRRW